jgi:hypothetical protein
MLVESPREEPTQAPLAHFNPQLLCHLGLYKFEFEFSDDSVSVPVLCNTVGLSDGAMSVLWSAVRFQCSVRP